LEAPFFRNWTHPENYKLKFSAMKGEEKVLLGFALTVIILNILIIKKTGHLSPVFLFWHLILESCLFLLPDHSP
jgi:uncharacterized integral membrane protein